MQQENKNDRITNMELESTTQLVSSHGSLLAVYSSWRVNIPQLRNIGVDCDILARRTDKYHRLKDKIIHLQLTYWLPNDIRTENLKNKYEDFLLQTNKKVVINIYLKSSISEARSFYNLVLRKGENEDQIIWKMFVHDGK